MSAPDRWDPAAEYVLHHDVVILLARHARAVDRRDWQAVLDAYHEDGVDNHGLFVGSPKEFVTWLEERMEHVEMIMHFHGTTTLLDVDRSQRSVLAETQCIGWQRLSTDAPRVPPNYLLEDQSTPGMAAMGVRYIDVLTERGGELRIQHRTVVHEWASVSPSRAAEAFGGRLQGAHGADDFSYKAIEEHRSRT